MNVSLLRFLETGALGDLRAGMSVDQIRDLLGKPHDTGNPSRRYPRPSIYVYGSVEVFFAQKPPILCVAISWYTHRGDFRLTPNDVVRDWELKPGMRQTEAEAYLKRAGLRYKNLPRPSLAVGETLVLPSNVKIVFDDDAVLHSIFMSA